MDVLLPIGELSKMTHAGVDELRRYDDVGLLGPATIDAATGDRGYSPDQVPVAQAVRRLRRLGLPVDRIRDVLAAPDLAARNAVIEQHLDEVQADRAGAQQTVASLQALLGAPPVAASVELRTIPDAWVLAIADTVPMAQGTTWLERALEELRTAVPAAGLEAGGPPGALYDEPLFHDEQGRITAFVPIAKGDLRTPTAGTGRTQLLELPGGPYAVLVHDGPAAELDRAYGAVGTAVATDRVGAPGAIREHHLPDGRVEVCWPLRS